MLPMRALPGSCGALKMTSEPMTITLTNEIHRMLPSRIRRKAGFRAGDQVEVQTSGGIVTLIPKLPAADDEYTPAQRRQIDVRLKEAKKGPFYGPFKDGNEIAAFLKALNPPKALAEKKSKVKPGR